jgi:hypothetical protein
LAKAFLFIVTLSRWLKPAAITGIYSGTYPAGAGMSPLDPKKKTSIVVLAE